MLGIERHLYSTDWCRGLSSGVTQILALGNAKIYQHVGISNAKFWRRGHCPTPTPDARYFVLQWNIDFTVHGRDGSRSESIEVQSDFRSDRGLRVSQKVGVKRDFMGGFIPL